jgi:hypothetical protein
MWSCNGNDEIFQLYSPSCCFTEKKKKDNFVGNKDITDCVFLLRYFSLNAGVTFSNLCVIMGVLAGEANSENGATTFGKETM